MRVNPKLSGVSDEEREILLAAYEDFRVELNGKEGKGWETVKVILMGEEKVHDAIRKLAAELTSVVGDGTDVKPKKTKKKAAAKEPEAEAVEAEAVEAEAEEATSEA
jgi:hypothetical protein